MNGSVWKFSKFQQIGGSVDNLKWVGKNGELGY